MERFTTIMRQLSDTVERTRGAEQEIRSSIIDTAKRGEREKASPYPLPKKKP